MTKTTSYPIREPHTEQLEQYFQRREDQTQGASLPEEKRKTRLRKKNGNKPQFGLRAELFRMTGTDLTQVDGIDVMAAATIISEVGWDMSKWKNEDHFGIQAPST
jgi:hypothetical protein